MTEVVVTIAHKGDEYTLRMVKVGDEWCCEDCDPKPANQAELDEIVWAAVDDAEDKWQRENELQRREYVAWLREEAY